MNPYIQCKKTYNSFVIFTIMLHIVHQIFTIILLTEKDGVKLCWVIDKKKIRINRLMSVSVVAEIVNKSKPTILPYEKKLCIN